MLENKKGRHLLRVQPRLSIQGQFQVRTIRKG